MKEQNRWSDFTRSNYKKLLERAIQTHRVQALMNWQDDSATAIWRHDVDYSPQSALATAAIERDLGVCATYYFNMRSEFYNLFEQDVVAIVKQISAMGHEVGLHFDGRINDVSTEQNLIEGLRVEKNAFETLLQQPVSSFSFHNPTPKTGEYKSYEYAGMINAYSSAFFEKFSYCSDSNGYWRFDSLEHFLDQRHKAICVLTHPNWWQDDALSPRDRIVRAVEGRARATLAGYDEQLRSDGRENLASS